jgi:CBS domain-containing protein
MEHEITTLPRIMLHSGIPVLAPDPKLAYVNLDDPALRVMIDFGNTAPITIEPIVSIDLALKKMSSMGVRLLLVTDQHDDIGGVITAYDISGEKPVQYSQETGIDHSEILVHMMMIPLEMFPAFDYEFVSQSLVRHVIASIKELERPHALVVGTDKKSGKQIIRGMFSSTHISKLLGRGVYDPLHCASSLADMQHELMH